MSTVKHDVTKISGIVTVTGGIGIWTLPRGMADEILMVGCRPAADSAEYDLYIQDEQDGYDIFRRDGNIGLYSELLTAAVPMWGDNSVYISGATVDGMYKIRLIYK